MLEVNYKTSSLFSLKKYKDSNLNCQSYEYPTIYAIRSAIIGAIIQVDGVEKAKDLFNKVKNTNIYIQYPSSCKVNVVKQKRYSNTYYSGCNSDEEFNKKSKDAKAKSYNKLDRGSLIAKNWCTTVGVRQYVDLSNITFYIDGMIPNLEVYLKNIDYIGTSESLVYLHSVEHTNSLKNVLKKWNKKDCTYIYEQHDWNSKAQFENIYMYSDKYKRMNNSYMCSVSDIILPT